jgi:hypothetical protein
MFAKTKHLHKGIKLSCLDYICQCGNRSNSLKLLNKLNSNINKVISIDTIYTTLIEYQILRNVLLTNEELSCLKALKKPVYDAKDQDHNIANLFDVGGITEQDYSRIRDLDDKTNKSVREEKLIKLYYARV